METMTTVIGEITVIWEDGIMKAKTGDKIEEVEEVDGNKKRNKEVAGIMKEEMVAEVAGNKTPLVVGEMNKEVAKVEEVVKAEEVAKVEEVVAKEVEVVKEVEVAEVAVHHPEEDGDNDFPCCNAVCIAKLTLNDYN